MDNFKNIELNGMEKIAKTVSSTLKGNEIICLYGDLGSGKTTFVKFLGSYLGIDKDITSPTFVIRNDYKALNFDVYHFDWYRLENNTELFNIGFFDVIDNGIVIIEWADKFQDIIKNFIRIDLYFEYESLDKRSIKIQNGYNN